VDLGAEGDGGREFVDALLDSEPNRLSEGFRERLARNTEGHPLFTVEILRSMREHEVLAQDPHGRWTEGAAITWNALPTRVEGVIERRLHRLESDLREVLITASVEGESFTAEVAARVCDVNPGQMIRWLSEDLARRHHLVRAGGVRQVNGRRLSRYHFSHHLFMAHLRDSLDPVERAHRHEAVGRALEALYEGETETIAARLAEHFREAGRLDRAVTYLTEAGDAAARVYANPEAIATYCQAIDLALQAGGESRTLTHLHTRLGRVLELESRFAEALDVYEAMEAIAQEHGDRRMLLASLTARAKIRSMPTSLHDPERGRVLGGRALTLARDLGDQIAEARILWIVCLANQWAGRWREAIDCGERSLALARQLDRREQLAQTLNDLGSICYLYTGRLDHARATLREAGDLWRELGNLPMLADSLASAAVACVYAGAYDRAAERSDEALRISQSTGNLWGQSYSQWVVGWAFWERGQWSRAIEVMNASIRLGARAGFGATQTSTRSDLAIAWADLGDVARGLEIAQRALSAGDTRHHRVDRAKTLATLAHLHLLAGRLDDAEVRMEEARNDPYRSAWPLLVVAVDVVEVELALAKHAYGRALAHADDLIDDLERWGAYAYVPHARYLRGLALEGLGRTHDARAGFGAARAAAEAVGSLRALWRILPALARVTDREEEATSAHRRAREIVHTIANHIEDEALRTSFLDQPDVRALEGA
jgi:tetratricopeptide (TPR) repeat protein